MNYSPKKYKKFESYVLMLQATTIKMTFQPLFYSGDYKTLGDYL